MDGIASSIVLNLTSSEKRRRQFYVRKLINGGSAVRKAEQKEPPTHIHIRDDRFDA